MKLANPLLEDFNTPFGVPPFEEIKAEDYKQAFEVGIDQHEKEIQAIVNNQEAPDFGNTIEAFERSGKLLNRNNLVFENILSSETSDILQQIAKEQAPLLSDHWDNILMNSKLFERIEQVYQEKSKLNLSTEQKMLLDKIRKDFVRGGAKLSDSDKLKLKEINAKLSVLSLQFGDNVLADNNAFELFITDEKDLAGLPESVIDAASESAKKKGQSEGWSFNLNKPSLIPFLQYAENRELRKKMYLAYYQRGNNHNLNNNKAILKQMVNLRLKKAKMLGYKTYSDYTLEESMAKKPKAVFDLLSKITPAAIELAKMEKERLQEISDQDKDNITIEPWDWWYYTEKLRKEKYDLDETQLRPYFPLENTVKGLFDVLNKLYGITFKINREIPVYQKDVLPYEVHEEGGNLTGILYMDFFPRPSKQGGAWMTAYRDQHFENGKNVIPIISVNFNFTSPTKSKPALLSFEEVETLFHECGHAIHGLFSNCKYESLAGTEVPRDFVEMPSQILENWASEPEVLKSYARHYKSGNPIPDKLIEKLEASRKFNLGFNLTEYLAATHLDMSWHTLTTIFTGEVDEFEKDSMSRIQLIREILPRYRSTFFNHIFSGGYASGYYSYVWSEVIDADAFQAFKETSLFDKSTAERFRKEILAKGGTEDPMQLFKNFRGREPETDAYMKKKGLN